MIGLVPGTLQTLVIDGTFENTEEHTEGHLYIDPSDQRLYYYSENLTRSSPQTEFFPVWDGERKYIGVYSNERYYTESDNHSDISISSVINSQKADELTRTQKRCLNNVPLEPVIRATDNMFTQLVKSVIVTKGYGMVDLIENSGMDESDVKSYYSALNRISFMRLDRWLIWVNRLLGVSYRVTVYRGETQLVSYDYPGETYSPSSRDYDEYYDDRDDQLKRLVKILMGAEGIHKDQLRGSDTDDYTVNNFLTTLGSRKPVSAQLFSRFIRITGLSYTVSVIESDNELVSFRE